MGLRASTFKKKSKISKIWQGCQFLIFFFYLNFKVLQKMILRAQFLLHLQFLYSKMFVIFTGMLPYNFFKKNIGLKGGRGGKTEEKTPLLVKKNKNFFLVIIFIPKLFLLLFLIKTSFSEDFGSKNI